MSSRGCAAANRSALSFALCVFAGAVPQASAVALELRAATEIAAFHIAYEERIAEIFVNGQRRGEFTVYRDAAGDYYFRTLDAEALGLAGPTGPGPLLAVRWLEPSEVVFDERHLTLRVTLAASR